MNICIRDAVAAVAAVSLAVSLAACGQGGGNGASGGSGPKIGLLMPDAVTPRWETDDRPLLEKKIGELCRDCRVEHANAKGDVATQQQQVDSMITKGVDAVVLVPVDARSLSAAGRRTTRASRSSPTTASPRARSRAMFPSTVRRSAGSRAGRF
jgi:D-xylose transport system substrate-binding protein